MTTQDRNKTNPTGKPQQQQPRQDPQKNDPSRSSSEPSRDSERR